MIEHNIENIRRSAIPEIKERINILKSEGRSYVHPCCKEFQGDIKRLKFDTGNVYVVWMQQNGILKNPTKVRQEGEDICAQKLGFKDENDRYNVYKNDWKRNKRYNTGEQIPMSENPDCSRWFGEFIAENYVMKTFEDYIKAPPNNPGFDWTCNKGQKVQHKARCLEIACTTFGWGFPIRRNNVPDYFILSAWKDRQSLTPMFVWIFRRDEIIRGSKFWERPSFWITNKSEYIREFENHEVKDKLEKLKEYIKEFKKENDIGQEK